MPAKARRFRVGREWDRPVLSDPQFERQWAELVDYLDRNGLVFDDGGFFAPSASHLSQSTPSHLSSFGNLIRGAEARGWVTRIGPRWVLP
jgi:hypothetical protein